MFGRQRFKWWNERKCEMFEGNEWVNIMWRRKKLEHFSFAWQNVQHTTHAAAAAVAVVALSNEAKLGQNGFTCAAIDFTLVKCECAYVCSLCILYIRGFYQINFLHEWTDYYLPLIFSFLLSLNTINRVQHTHQLTRTHVLRPFEVRTIFVRRSHCFG